MKATTFPQFNFNLGAGNNPNTSDLPIAICESRAPGEQDVAFLISRWKLSPEEIARINETGELWLGVMTTKPAEDQLGKLHLTNTMPPVLLTVNDPFGDVEKFVPYDADKFLP
jgi:hypothetical protein